MFLLSFMFYDFHTFVCNIKLNLSLLIKLINLFKIYILVTLTGMSKL